MIRGFHGGETEIAVFCVVVPLVWLLETNVPEAVLLSPNYTEQRFRKPRFTDLIGSK
jgi:hypothetical protein